jgi:hypothetical protein
MIRAIWTSRLVPSSFPSHDSKQPVTTPAVSRLPRARMEDSCRRSLTGFQEHHPGLALTKPPCTPCTHRAAHPVLPYQKGANSTEGEVIDSNLARALAPSLSQQRPETRHSTLVPRTRAPIPHNHSSPSAHLRDARKAVVLPIRPRAPTRKRNQDFPEKDWDSVEAR